MRRWMIEIDDEVAERVAGEAAERGVAPEQLAAELIARGALGTSRRRRRFAFIGMGDSGPAGDDLGRRHREVIRDSSAHMSAREE